MPIEQLDDPVDPDASLETRAVFIDRDLSDLAFVQRVLEEAENPKNPVLERTRYLAITGMLLDEFYRIRVAALREQIRQQPAKQIPGAAKPSKQLKRADKFSNRLILRQDRCWRQLRRDLRAVGIELITDGRTASDEMDWLAEYFRERIKPQLAPALGQTAAALAAIKDGDLLLFAEIASPTGDARATEAVVPIPTHLPRFTALPGSTHRLAPIETVITLFLDELFPGAAVTASGLARVLREGSLKHDGDGDDLLRRVRDAIARRERAEVIRLRVERSMPEQLTSKLATRLGLLRPEEIKALEKSRRRATTSEFVVADTFLGLPDLTQLVALLPAEFSEKFCYTPIAPARPVFVREFDGDLFRAIAARDRMLHFPYDDFGVLVTLIEQAAADPSVVSIKQTLYRTGRDSPVVLALAAAARNGKKVEAVVELQAREDELSNIELAAFLESAGVNVSYGFLDLKVHAKLLIIERLEAGRIASYVQCSTGNYSVASGQSYTDVCLLSCDDSLAEDLQKLFTYVRVGVRPSGLEKLAIAPLGLRERIVALIRAEARNAERGQPAAIWIKLNKLSDEQIIRELYRASRAGVEIRLVVRGVCCLRPGVQGLSENIEVKSVVGRFLEHSRLLCFANGHELPSASAEVFLSSADFMPHKLDRRVEVLVSIEASDLKRRIQHEIFLPYFRDQANSWKLLPDDRWLRGSTEGFSVHRDLPRGT